MSKIWIHSKIQKRFYLSPMFYVFEVIFYIFLLYVSLGYCILIFTTFDS